MNFIDKNKIILKPPLHEIRQRQLLHISICDQEKRPQKPNNVSGNKPLA